MSETPETPDSVPDIPDSPVIPEMSSLFGKGDKGDRGAKGDKGDKGDRGNKGPIGESRLAQAAEAEVTRLVKAKTTPKWWGRALIVICLVLATVVGYLGYENVTHPISNQLRADIAATQQVTANLRTQNIENCESNNKFRAAQVATWEKNFALQGAESKATGALLQQLIGTLTSHDPKRIAEVNKILAQSDKDNAAETQQFLIFVKNVDAPKNCQLLYAPTK
jgi:hypothetical protein